VTLAERVLAGERALLDEETLLAYVQPQRWFGAKSEDVAHASVLDTAVLRSEPPLLVTALTEIRFHTGTHQTYQLLLGLRPADEGWDGDVIAEREGFVVYDGPADSELSRELVELMRAEATREAGGGAVEFRSLDGDTLADPGEPRLAGVEQSNTSIVFGREQILKVYRRLEAGVNPELELLRFLTERSFPNIAQLTGWFSYTGPLMDATLGIMQEYVPDAKDGWELALEELGRDPEAFLVRLRRLGEVTGSMHMTFGSDSSDPEFAPEETSQEALALLTATVDEEIESIFVNLPETEALAPIAGRGAEVRDRLQLMSHVGSAGRVIRHHGDYHLGQVLWDGEDWVVLDFEGEPARSLPERRRKRSPLRDVAGMLRSFAYAATAYEFRAGSPPPEGWEERARKEFLDGYFSTVDRTLVPPSEEGRNRLLSVFELEKAVYELRYELNNRPDWVRIPVAGILRLLESPL
jgi:trehalose synthase-fused probable maltokinase